jgi:hypothetical protein
MRRTQTCISLYNLNVTVVECCVVAMSQSSHIETKIRTYDFLVIFTVDLLLVFSLN